MGQDNEARRGDPACVALEAIEKAMRDHIKVDATGLSPAVASAYVVGFQEAAKAVAEIIARQAEALQRENAELREALKPFADVADLVDSETEGVADDDEFQMHFHDYLMASWKLSLFRRARALLGGENAE